MTLEEKATTILEAMGEYTQVNWNMKEFYLKGIINGLKKIQEEEKGEALE